MEARLLWRKFDRKYTEFAYRTNPEGFKRFGSVPDLPVTEISTDQISFGVSSPGSGLVAESDGNAVPGAAGWIRFNDYGIGLLLENDTRGATRAFEKVAEMEPDRLDGPLNLAKTSLQDGNIGEVYEHLRRCEEIEAGNPQVAWVWARVRQEDGLYEDAIQAYHYVLEYFPEDRAAWRQLGRTYYLDQQYKESIEAYRKALEIDPEDREAFYHLALNYRALGEKEEALRMEEAFEYYSIDESAAEIAQRYRRENPGDNLMTQDIRIHHLEFPDRLKDEALSEARTE